MLSPTKAEYPKHLALLPSFLEKDLSTEILSKEFLEGIMKFFVEVITRARSNTPVPYAYDLQTAKEDIMS